MKNGRCSILSTTFAIDSANDANSSLRRAQAATTCVADVVINFATSAAKDGAQLTTVTMTSKAISSGTETTMNIMTVVPAVMSAVS